MAQHDMDSAELRDAAWQDPDAVQFAQEILDSNFFGDIDTTPVTGTDVKAEFWADYGDHEYIIEVRRQPKNYQPRKPSTSSRPSGGVLPPS